MENPAADPFLTLGHAAFLLLSKIKERPMNRLPSCFIWRGFGH